jgi:hypothetical protein
MAVQYGEAFVNLFAPDLWNLKLEEVPKQNTEHPDVHLAMWHAGARELFNGEWSPLVALAIRQFMRRSIIAAKMYRAGRDELIRFSNGHQRDRPNLKAYFGALDAFENCILQLEFCVENLRHILPDSDSSELLDATRVLSEICKSIRHSGGQAKATMQSRKRKILPIYFENDGITNGIQKVKFAELNAVVEDFLGLTVRIYRNDSSSAE